jgi:glycosyltransferase involved in cell wall biosynthesis
MKVAIVGPPLDFLFGGQEVQAHGLLTQWQHDKEVIATFVSSRPTFPKLLAPFNRVPYVRTLLRLPLYVRNLFRVVGKVELVHIFAGAFGTFRWATVPAFLVAYLRGRKTLIHYHSGRGTEHLMQSSIARQILRACDAVVVPSEYLAASLRSYGIGSVTVGNTIDSDTYIYRSRGPLQPRLLCTRNLEAHYGIDVVIRAFARVQSVFPEASLRLVGTGREANEINKLIGTLALNRVQLLGAIPPAGMPAIYDQSDIFVNGSYVDCVPVSILEAFCSGLPVVTTAAGGISSLVEHDCTGLMCPCGDWKALADNIVRLLRHPEMVEPMTRKARERTILHSWQSLRPLWLSAYRDALKRSEHAPFDTRDGN